ncbi:MAG: hypothetical protein ACT4TC_09115, partial [Myxococcaceae bacterium]
PIQSKALLKIALSAEVQLLTVASHFAVSNFGVPPSESLQALLSNDDAREQILPPHAAINEETATNDAISTIRFFKRGILCIGAAG